MEEKALLGIVLFPLVGAIANGLLGRGASRQTVHFIAVASVAASFVFALFSFVKLVGIHDEGTNVALSAHIYEWFRITVPGQIRPIEVPVNVRFVMDALSGVMTLVVTGIGLLIHIYSTGYMSEEKSYARFFSYLNLFTASMLILVLGSNLPLMFVGWEGVGLCSYLLIGFWWENPAYAAAGRKAFVANRIGDFGVLIGMFLLVAAVQSFEFSEINEKARLLEAGISLGGVQVSTVSVATAAALFLFLGCAGKSAQIPLYVWLPDAMAGPTPVSALIHAATMVTSGLYLICRLSPVFAAAPDAMAVIAVIGALTALLAATIGCVQVEIKKVLAYSTVSQLGFMFAAAGCGAFAASFFHVYTHAFFKACLFLGAGSVMHAVGAHGDADIRRLGGLRKYMPRTHWTFLVSCAAIAGVPFFSGFFSKDEILVGALSAGHYFAIPQLGMLIFVMLVIAATMTAFYMFRLYFMTFAGEYRGGPEHHAEHGDAAHAAHGEHSGDGGHGDEEAAHGHGEPHESPDSMTIPLVLLGIGAIFGGYLWVGAAGLVGAHWDPWVQWLAPALGSIGEEHHDTSVLLTAIAGGTLAMLAGVGLAWSWYAKPGNEAPARLAAQFPRLHQLVFDKWRVDELYDATILRASRGLGLLSAGVDKAVVDGLLSTVTSQGVKALGFLFTRLQSGLVQAYAAAMVVGFAGIGWWFTFPHADLAEAQDAEATGTDVTLVAGAGLGYLYRWDFDSDGEPDTQWVEAPTADYTYVDDDFEPGVELVLESSLYGGGFVRRRLQPGESWAIPLEHCGIWQRSPDDRTPPLIEVDEEGTLLIQPNGARVRNKDREQVAADEKVTLGRGEYVDVGQARLHVAGAARATLHVKNAFGVEARETLALSLPRVKRRPAVRVEGATPGGTR